MVLYDKGKRFAEVRDGEIYDDKLGPIAELHEGHPHP